MGVDDLISEPVSEHATYVLCGLSRAERAVKWAELAQQVEQNLWASIRYEEERMEQERLQEEEDAQSSHISGSSSSDEESCKVWRDTGPQNKRARHSQ